MGFKSSSASWLVLGRLYIVAVPLVAIFIGANFFNESYIETLVLGDIGVIGGWDAAFYYFWLRSPLFDFDVSFNNEVLFFNAWPPDLRERILSAPLTSQGLVSNKYPIGWALVSLPWMVLSHCVAFGLNLLGLNVVLNGYSTPYQFGIAIGQLFYAAISLFLATSILQWQFKIPRTKSAYLVSICWLGSFMLLYQTSELFMAHNATFFCLAVTYSYAQKFRDRPTLLFAVVVGLFSGLTLLCRPPTIPFLFYPAYLFCQGLAGSRSARLMTLVAAASAGCIVLIQFVAWKLLFGSYFVYSYSGESFNWSRPQIINILFSPFHGLFYWHPIYLIGFLSLGYYSFAGKSREVGIILSSVIAGSYINSAWHNWWYGVSFGNRAFDASTLAVMFGYAAIFSDLTLGKNKKIAIHAFLAVAACWNVQLVTLSLWGYLPLDRAVSYSQMIDLIPRFFQRLLVI